MISRRSEDADFRLAFSVRCFSLQGRGVGRAHFTRAARMAKQFSSHFHATLTNDECSVKVFNSSVENRVEKARPKIEIARQYRAYCSLHNFGAEEAVLKARTGWSFLVWRYFSRDGKNFK
jgi:hypothetical protein